MLKTTGKVHVERDTLPEKLTIDRSITEKGDAYPVTIEIRHKEYDQDSSEVNSAEKSNGAPSNGIKTVQQTAKSERVEIIKAKYLLGCDGGHSWTRRQVGLPLEGEQSDHVWGVIDIIPLTDFRMLFFSGVYLLLLEIEKRVNVLTLFSGYPSIFGHSLRKQWQYHDRSSRRSAQPTLHSTERRGQQLRSFSNHS